MTTNIVGIIGAGSAVEGTYLGTPYGMTWTNLFSPTEIITLTGGNYYLASNSIILYQSSTITNWTIVSGTAPAPIGFWGTKWRMTGTMADGWFYSTNFVLQSSNLATAIASNLVAYSTNNVPLNGVLSGLNPATVFSLTGSNYIASVSTAILAGYTGPTNGVTATQVTNIANALILGATNTLWGAITNRGAVTWGSVTNPITAPRPATLYYFVTNGAPQYGILSTN